MHLLFEDGHPASHRPPPAKVAGPADLKDDLERAAAAAPAMQAWRDRRWWQNPLDAYNAVTIGTLMLGGLALVAAFFPYLLVTTGTIVRSSIPLFVIPAAGILLYSLVLLLGLLDGDFFSNQFRWILRGTGAQEGRLYFGDRFHNLFNAFAGLAVNALVFVGWLVFFVANRGVDTLAEFEASGINSLSSYKALGGASACAYLLLFLFAIGSLLVNIGLRKNRDLTRLLVLHSRGVSLEEFVLQYNETIA